MSEESNVSERRCKDCNKLLVREKGNRCTRCKLQRRNKGVLVGTGAVASVATGALIVKAAKDGDLPTS